MTVFLPISYRCIILYYYFIIILLHGHICGIWKFLDQRVIQASAVVLPDIWTTCPQLGTKSRYRTQASATQDTAVKSWTHCTTAGTPKAPFYFQIPISQFYFILFFIIYIHIFFYHWYIYIYLSFIYIYIYFGGHSMVTQLHIHVYLFWSQVSGTIQTLIFLTYDCSKLIFFSTLLFIPKIEIIICRSWLQLNQLIIIKSVVFTAINFVDKFS